MAKINTNNKYNDDAEKTQPIMLLSWRFNPKLINKVKTLLGFLRFITKFHVKMLSHTLQDKEAFSR